MRRLLLFLICSLLAVGCAARPALTPPPVPDMPQPSADQAAHAQDSPEPPAPPGSSAPVTPRRLPTRDQFRGELVRLLNDGEGTLEQKLNWAAGPTYSKVEVPWLEADLDGDGDQEYVVVREVQDGDGRPGDGHGAALFVIYQTDGKWTVDRSDPMDWRLESDLKSPRLYAAADLVGTGRPQIVWSRPELIATGPQPHFVFVTAWEPGQFTHIPGEMALSNSRLQLEGRDLVLTGISRNNTYLPVMERADRYRYADGAFRLVDRRFSQHPEDGYARLWNALVAEEPCRVQDAETAYRQVLEPERPVHSGTILGYKVAPRRLTEAELVRFGEALRAFARFRLGALLLQEGRGDESAAVMEAREEAYQGLFAATRQSPDRETACRAARDWSSANPEFLDALNIGVGTSPWTPELICSHIDIDEHGFWER